MSYLTLTVLCLTLAAMGVKTIPEKYFQEYRRLSKAIVEALQDSKYDEELLFDLRKENQVYLNRTMSLLIKYIVKREVDNYRARRTDAISRRVYSALIMKLIDIAKDLPRNTSATARVDTAHRYYTSAENRDVHDKMADGQVFHACARLYDVMFTVPEELCNEKYLVTYVHGDGSAILYGYQFIPYHNPRYLYYKAPRIISHLGNLEDLTPRLLVKHLMELQIKPVHFAITLLIQYHLRNTVNFAIRSNALDVLATRPRMVGADVIEMLKALASRLLPVSELLDIHLAHYSPAFKDTCPSTWLGIVNNKQP